MRVLQVPREHAVRRATVLLAVLVAVVIAAMVGTTALYVADGQIAATRTAGRAAQSRAMAWSGVQMAMAELLSQREALIDGGRPEVTREYVTPVTGSAPSPIARLIELSPGEFAAPEAGKLDVNTASDEMLVATGLLDATVAGRIVAGAAQRPFSSVEELLGIEGVTPEMVYGAAAESGAGSVVASGARPATLGDVLTAYSFDPDIQAGVGDRGADHRGTRRINIATEWSDELGRAVSNRFGSDAAKVLEQIMKGGTKFAKVSDVVALLRRLNVPPADWGPILDTFTTSADEYLIGRVDLSTAGAQVLACVPGISSDAADQIVRERDRLGADAKRSVVWPVTTGILGQDQFQSAVDFLTTRCLQWRVRVEAGFPGVRESSPVEGGSGARSGGTADRSSTSVESAEGRLTDRVVYEAVLDVSSRRPRVAYLREITMLPGAYAMYRAALGTQPHPDAATPQEPDADQEPASDLEGGGLDMETDLDLGGLDFSSHGEKSREGGRGADPTVPADGQAPPGGLDGASKDGTATTPSQGGGTGTNQVPAADRRIGRWTTGSRGGKGGSSGGGGGGSP